MTMHDEQPEDDSSEPVKPTVESIHIGFGRGSYSATQDTEDSSLLFERFLDRSKGPSEPYPDIDGNFVDGDRIRAQTMEYLTQKYRSKSSNTETSPVLDGYSDKDEFTRQAREGDNAFPIHNAEWFHLSIGPNGFFR